MKLRRDDRCVRCGTSTPAGAPAYWDAEAGRVLCLSCHTADAAPTVEPASPPPPHPAPTPLPPPRPIDVGVAGASARSEAERRAATDAPAHARENWAKGAAGEERLGDYFASELPGAAVLHDRTVPGTRGNIDHLVVSPAGAWVIDAKNWTGRVELRSKGTPWRPDHRLHVGGRDRTRAVAGMRWQVDAVRAVLEPMGYGAVPVLPALCFVESDWGFRLRPFEIDTVLIGWPRAIVQRIVAAPPLLTTDAIVAITTEVSAKLRPAVPVGP